MRKLYESNQINEDAPLYTCTQVMEKLGVTRPTVYSYAERGYIESVEHPYNNRCRKLYTQKSVEQYLLTLCSLPKGQISIQELSNEINVPVSRIRTLLGSHKLPYEVNKTNFRYPTACINVELKPKIMDLLKSKHNSMSAKYDFSNDLGYTIFQLFRDSLGNEYRLLKKGKELVEWGFMLSRQSFLPLELALSEQGFSAVYKVNTQPSFAGSYLMFIFNIHEEKTFLFLDYLYQYWGIKNLYITEAEGENTGELHVHVRENSHTINDDLLDTLTIEWLQNALKKGKVTMDNRKLSLSINRKQYGSKLSIEAIESIKEVAEENDIDQSAALELIIEYYQKNKQSK